MIFSFERLLKVALCAVGVDGAISLLAKLCRQVCGITVRDTELGRQRLGLTDIILWEVLQGVRDDVVAKEVERRLLTLEVFETGGVALAREAAQNYRALGSRGHTMRKTIDSLIATFCLRAQHDLLHRDRDFDPFEKYLHLSVIHP
jgi:predicted nucleic acid-binding protein